MMKTVIDHDNPHITIIVIMIMIMIIRIWIRIIMKWVSLPELILIKLIFQPLNLTHLTTFLKGG